MPAPFAAQPRVMLFVDGSNLLIEMFKMYGAKQKAEKPIDAAIHLAHQTIEKALLALSIDLDIAPIRRIRRYWFGSVQGSPANLEDRRVVLHRVGYDAELFLKKKGRGEKGVDLAVARQMLMHGYYKNYDVAVLVAGDEDYVGLVQDLKRLGLTVAGLFFETEAFSKG